MFNKVNMMRRDYILRMVEKLAQMLSRIRERVASGQPHEAGVVLDQAFLELVGMGPEAVSQLTETELLARLTQDESTLMVREKSLVLVALLEEAARIRAAEQLEAESQACRLKALDLLLTLQLQDTDFELPDFVPKIELLRQELGEFPLPLRTLAALWRYYERIGAYGQAEDALFELRQAQPDNPALLAEARTFYERLLRQSDASLESGNLPRAEVTASLTELRAPNR